MARAVQGNLCIEPFPPSGSPDHWRCALKSLRSVPKFGVFSAGGRGRVARADAEYQPQPAQHHDAGVHRRHSVAQLREQHEHGHHVLGYAAGYVVAYVASDRQRIHAAKHYHYGRSAAGQRHPIYDFALRV